MAKVRIRRQFDPTYKGCKGEKNSMESMTQPDQSLTIKQLLLNHTRNIASDINVREEHYFEDTEIPRIDDLNDIAEYREALEDKRKAAEAFLNDEYQKKVSELEKIEKDAQKPPKEVPDPPKEETKE